MTKKLEIGKLYRYPEYHLMVYPSIQIAVRAGRVQPAPAPTLRDASWRAHYWSKRLNCTVRYSEPNEIFMVVDHEKEKDDTDFYHVIFGEIQGWMIVDDCMKIEKTL